MIEIDSGKLIYRRRHLKEKMWKSNQIVIVGLNAGFSGGG